VVQLSPYHIRKKRLGRILASELEMRRRERERGGKSGERVRFLGRGQKIFRQPQARLR
jgi:hypothetical protein